MKKIYLSAVLVALSASTVLAQRTERPYSFGQLNYDEKAPVSTTPVQKALGVTFWTEDFSGGQGAWTIDNSGQTGAEFGWTVDATSDGWWSSGGINSTSGGNYAELSNGDPTQNPGTQALNVTYTLTSPMIDIAGLGGSDQMTLTFQEFGARFNDLQEVQVSTNGTTFTTVRNNLNYSVLSSTGGDPYANPENISVNLAPYTTGATNVWIRFSWTTNFPNSASNPNVWVAYGWYIDDIALTTNADNEIEAQSPYWGSNGLPYYQIPGAQVAPIDFSADAFNGGTATQNNVTLNVDINTGTFTGTSAGATIAPGQTDSIGLTTQFTPPATPTTYNVDWNISQTETDDIPVNNALPAVSFQVTDFIYARDNNSVDGGTFNSGNQFEAGPLFEVFANANIYSVDVRIASNAVVGANVYAKLYSIDGQGNFVQEDQSNYFELAANNIGQWINLDFLSGTSGFPLAAGSTYLVVIASDGDGGASNDLVVATAGESDPQTCFYFDGTDQTWYYTTSTPMVRMNFDPASNTVGVEENDQVFGVALYPNPTSNDLNIQYTLGNASGVQVAVVDVMGKEVATFNEGVQTEGAHTLNVNAASFANGVYYVNITSDATTVTKKFIKK